MVQIYANVAWFKKQTSIHHIDEHDRHEGTLLYFVFPSPVSCHQVLGMMILYRNMNQDI